MAAALAAPALASAASAPMAEARLAPASGQSAHGLLRLEQRGGMLHVRATIAGLSPGLHAFHIHSHADCKAAGGHFDPAAGRDGGERSEHHGGEFGSLTAGENGEATLNLLLPLNQISLDAAQQNSVLRRSVVVHGSPDAYAAQQGTKAGQALACGVIEASRR